MNTNIDRCKGVCKVFSREITGKLLRLYLEKYSLRWLILYRIVDQYMNDCLMLFPIIRMVCSEVNFFCTINEYFHIELIEDA